MANSLLNLLVYGWYDKNNLGDELFKPSFKKLIKHNLTFINSFKNIDYSQYDGVIFGGGSILYDEPEHIDISKLIGKQIFYVGIGAEGQIHFTHKTLLSQANAIFLRSNDNFEYIKKINKNTYITNDIVYSLRPGAKFKQQNKVLIIPNISVVPTYNDEHWKHTSYNYFKSQFCQFLDNLVKHYDIEFLSMCNNDKLDDKWAISNLISNMTLRNNYKIHTLEPNEFSISDLSIYKCIITQRFHGKVLADINNVPSLVISHHDKLNIDNYISYYECSKHNIENSFNKTLNYKINKIYNFDELKRIFV